MTVAVTLSTGYRPFDNDGVSAASRRIAEMVHAAARHLATPVSARGKTTAKESLMTLLDDCAEAGWDGYKARPLEIAAATDAAIFIDALPAGIALPDVTPEQGGGVGLEWRRGDRAFLVSLLGQGRLLYGGVLAAGDKAHGSRSFVREIPQSVLDILARDFAVC